MIPKGLNGRPLTSPAMVIISIKCGKKRCSCPGMLLLTAHCCLLMLKKINKEKKNRWPQHIWRGEGGKVGSGFTLVKFGVCFWCGRLVFYLPSSFTACLFSPSLPLSPSLSSPSARSQPRRRQEVRPRHSTLPATSAGSPSQITPPTVRYFLKKSSIPFGLAISPLLSHCPPPPGGI